MADIQNTSVYKEDWTTRLQARLSEPNKWKEICRVEYTNERKLHNPYLSDITVQTPSRGSSYTIQATTMTDDNVTFSSIGLAPQFIDRADLAQTGYDLQMEIAERQAQQLDETIESGVYGAFSQFYTADNAVLLGDSAGSITVSSSNVDDMIRNIKKVIRLANGEGLLERNGGFVVWRPADFELLEQFAQANGFQESDRIIRGGAVQGFRYLGLDHFTSNLLKSGRIIAGVKRVLHLGVLRATYGQVMFDEHDPAQLSGVSVVSRVDYGVKLWKNVGSLVMDIGVA